MIEAITLARLEIGDKFILLRSGNKYRLEDDQGYRRFVKPVNHTTGMTRSNGTFFRFACTLHHSCLVMKV